MGGSEHFPVTAMVKGGGPMHSRRKQEVEKERKVNMCRYGGNKLNEFREKIEHDNLRCIEEEGVDDKIERMTRVIEKIREKVRTK